MWQIYTRPTSASDFFKQISRVFELVRGLNGKNMADDGNIAKDLPKNMFFILKSLKIKMLFMALTVTPRWFLVHFCTFDYFRKFEPIFKR
jgi:hypothetical protein